MNDNIYIINTKKIYDNNKYFNPSKKYVEGLNINIKSDEEIYDSVRKLFIEMELDKENIGQKNWNPLGKFIKEGNNVIIKPNLVTHDNKSMTGTTDSLITNFSIIRPIIDYCLIALKNTGSIIVGDAPVQECIFEKVIKINGLKEGIDIYNNNKYRVQLIDFRKNENKNLKCKIVPVDQYSSFVEIDDFSNKYAITNYDLREMRKHHGSGKHEYCIPQYVLDADVIINLPKPKCHRKAGITSCMKNFVGINSKKEYLPHHRNGSIKNNGDEYPEKSLIKLIQSNLKNYTYKKSTMINFLNKCLHFTEKKLNKARYLEGSWYGNDTIWRTILDINKIVLYADKNGILTNQKQREIFNVCDMIISGEKEGPLIPSDKKVGLIVMGQNCLNTDYVICQIMGFNPDKIKYIKNGYLLKNHIISSNKEFNIYDEKGLADLKKYNKNFIPTDGWIDYLK